MRPLREGLLGGNRDFRSLFAARSISHIGDGMALIALLLYVEDTEESGLAVGMFLLAASLPVLLTGLVAGSVVDRTDQRRLMIACDVGQVFLYAAIAVFLPPFPVLLGLVGLTSVLDALFSPAGRSSVPALVAAEDLRAANAWLTTAMNMQVVVGPLLGGLATAALGFRAALFANALTFAVSALFLLRLPPLPPAAAAGERATFWGDVRAGFSYIAHHSAARAVVLALFFGVAFAAVDNVALVFLARDVLDAGAVGFGLLASAFGVGMLAASITLIGPRVKLAAGALFLLGMLLSGAGTLSTGLAPLLLVAIVAQAIAGAGNSVQLIGQDTLVQQVVAREMLGRVFALIRTAAIAGGSLAALAGGVLLDVTSPRTVFVLGGVGVLCVALLTWLLLPTATRSSAR